MSTTLTLGVVTLQLPLEVEHHDDVSYVNGFTGEFGYASLRFDGHRELATLFAAAPYLLVAAEDVVASAREEDWGRLITIVPAELIDALRTAIARARGKENT